ncbi:unnamed protein product [Caenorhabditis nigoni]
MALKLGLITMEPFGLTAEEEMEFLRKKNRSLEDENEKLKQEVSQGVKIRMLLESRVTLLDPSSEMQKEEQEKAEKWKKKKNIVHISVTSVEKSGSSQKFEKCYPLPVFHKKFFEIQNTTSEGFFNKFEELGKASHKTTMLDKSTETEDGDTETEFAELDKTKHGNVNCDIDLNFSMISFNDTTPALDDTGSISDHEVGNVDVDLDYSIGSVHDTAPTLDASGNSSDPEISNVDIGLNVSMSSTTMDVSGNVSASNLAHDSDEVDIANKADISKFVTKSNAILWEDDYIQVGCKLETRRNLGRLDMFYGNKTSEPFNKFTPNITCPGALAVQLQAQANPVEPIVAAGTQVLQVINFVCVQEFQKMPIMNIKFTFTNRAGAIQNFDKNFYLPLFISKFFEPTNMTLKQFYKKWRSLDATSQKAQKIFAAQSPMETVAIETKLKGFGANLLTEVDTDSDNYVFAGIIHTQTQKIEALIKLEPDEQSSTCRLTIRSIEENVSQTLADLLSAILKAPDAPYVPKPNADDKLMLNIMENPHTIRMLNSALESKGFSKKKIKQTVDRLWQRDYIRADRPDRRGHFKAAGADGGGFWWIPAKN